MASIVAFIELRKGAITGPSHCAVAEARRVADAAGATVYALLTVGLLTQVEMDRLASEVSAAGADRIFCSSAESLAGPPLDATHGAILAQVAKHLRPVLFLFPAGGVGTQLGPSLAVRIGAAYMANASIEIRAEERGSDPASKRILLFRWRAARDSLRKIDVGDLERPAVASLASGVIPLPVGEPYAEVEMVPCPDSKFPKTLPIDSNVDDGAEFELCRALVLSGRPASATASDALRAELPPGTTLVFADEANDPPIGFATPCEWFILPSASAAPNIALPKLAPGALVARVGSESGIGARPSATADDSPSTDAELTEFADALGRARSKGAPS
jgi:electron transfer flavoprotein alpha subunit